jgi:carboxymethylenebutenolidase
VSDFSEFYSKTVNRRDFIVTASAAAGFCVLNCEGSAQQVASSEIARALDDDRIIHSNVSFLSGNNKISAYLSRPKKPGRFPIVIVVTGSTISDEYIQNLTAMLAQQGFIGIAPDIFSLQKDSMTPEEKRKVFVEQITDERIYQDLQAAIDYLKKQNYTKASRIGITGFCFGGRCALMFAAHSKEIDAIVPFYGNLRTPSFANRKQDPLDVIGKLKVPIQGHYAQNDPEISADQLRDFEQSLKQQGVRVEIFTYDAPHGFFAYNRRTYNQAAAEISWRRTADFFRQHLGK